MTLEMELGITGGEEDGVDNTDVDESKLYTQPEEVAYAYEELTGISINDIVIIMAVESDKPLLFRETKDRWIEPLKQVITKYS